jgi:phosphoenolpyruvate carboxykinase (ATP)
MKQQNVKVWMVNTGWSGGVFGKGNRISLQYTRAMITAALEGRLDGVEYSPHPVFGMAMPQSCPGVPPELLNPRNTWPDPAAYDQMADEVAGWFIKNFGKYADGVDSEILAAAPVPGGKK